MSEQEWAAKNKTLAEALGWTDIHEAERWSGSEDGYYTFTELRGTSPDGVERWLPDFYGSVDACLDVLPRQWDVCITFGVFKEHGACFIAQLHDGDGDKQQPEGYGATRAEALAEAVLSWAQALHADRGSAG